MFSTVSLLRSGGRHASGWIAGSAIAATGVVAFSSSSSSSISISDSSYRSSSTSTTSLEAASKSGYVGNASTLRRRMTAIGHFSLISETVENPSIATFLLTLETPKHQPWTVERFCQLWKDSEMSQRHPRFHLSVADEEKGYFGQQEDEVEFYISESLPPMVPRLDVLERIKSWQTERWDYGEKLWQITLVPWMKAGLAGTTKAKPPVESVSSPLTTPYQMAKEDEMGESLLLFRGHHALADGASMVAAIMDLADEAPQVREAIINEIEKRFGPASWWRRLYQRILFALWLWTGSFATAWYQFRLYLDDLFRKAEDPWTILENLAKEERIALAVSDSPLQPTRSVSFATCCSVDQAKWVARTLAGKRATLNDVFCTAVSKAMARQLAWHRERLGDLPRLEHFHLAVPVHLKGGIIIPGESVGNNIGAFTVRLPCEGTSSSEERLRQVHRELSVAKKLPTAFLAHYLAKFTSLVLPQSWATSLYSRATASSSCVVTNVKGFDRPIHLNGSKVLSAYGFVPLAPGLPIGVAVGSYNGEVTLTVTAQPWAVPDADQFTSWIMEEYLELVQAASNKNNYS